MKQHTRTSWKPTTERTDLFYFPTLTRIVEYSRTDKDTYYKIETYMIIDGQEVIISTAYGSPEKIENLEHLFNVKITEIKGS
jgi:hypothetical protein